jgi:hypothetical protein
MQAQGHRPDVGVYNVVIEALTRSGVLSAQLKAAQIFQAATRQGQLRCGDTLSLSAFLAPRHGCHGPAKTSWNSL